MKGLLCFALFALAGCAALDRSEERGVEYRLKLAGFKAVPAGAQELAKITPFKLEAWQKEGRVIYRYADPNKGRIYEGGSREYQQYRDIARDTQERRVSNLNQIGPRRPVGPLLW